MILRCFCVVCIVICSSLLPAEDSSSAENLEFFESQVRPLLIRRCYSCHSKQADTAEGGLRLDSQKGWKDGGENGPAILPGEVNESLLIQAVRYDNPDLQMPPDQKLPAREIAVFEEWVLKGALDPRDDQEQLNMKPKASDPISGRSHWAFQLLNVKPPEESISRLNQTTIDKYLDMKLNANGLSSAPRTSKEILAKRLYIQLTGLPPTPEEIKAYLVNEDKKATEELVDELLESNQFGERWGRHWLDLARYADSNGLDENFLFREAWRYRNWVISAINSGMPLDQFITQQIAGDLLPFETIEQRDQQRIAAGFMLLGPKVLLGNNPENQKMEIADEQINTISKTFLAQTVGCAKCHDHKFDPIPTRDYYALAGIMTSTNVMEQRYMLGQQRVMEQLVGLGEEGDKVDDAYEKYWRERAQLKTKLDQAKQVLTHFEKNELKKILEIQSKHQDALVESLRDAKAFSEASITLQKSYVENLEKQYKSPPAIPPRAMIPLDRKNPADEKIRVAGQFNKPGKSIPRGFLQVLSSEETPLIPVDQSGRLELARWITDTEAGAGHLTARVLANRIWKHLIGTGIVRTVDNFGRTGEEPSHPELLDYLADRLISSGWSMKSLIREIVLTDAFSRSSPHQQHEYEIDPENRLLWRAHRRRLDPESLRDAMMQSAGILDLSPLDSSVSYLGDQATAVGANTNRRRTDFPNRSVYLPVIRNDLPEIFEVFDFTNPHVTTGMRSETIVATQGLFLLNNETVMNAATATAQRALDALPEATLMQRIELIYQIILLEDPERDELHEMAHFVRSMEQVYSSQSDENPEKKALKLACQALFASSRFQILE